MREAAELAGSRGDRLLGCCVLTLSGRAAAALGEHGQGEDELAATAERAWQFRNHTAALDALAYLGESWLRLGDVERATPMLQMVARHAATAQSVRPKFSGA